MKLLVVSAVLALLSVAAIFGDGGSTASASCNPNRPDDATTRLVGWYRTPGVAVGGVYANVKIYNPYIYPASGPSQYENSIWTWVMLSDAATANWAQIGYIKLQQNFTGFIQWTDTGHGLHTWWYGPPPNDNPPTPGQYHYYTVLYGNYGPGYLTFYDGHNGVNYNKGIVAPEYSGGWQPTTAENQGETKSRASQMAGGLYNPVYFADSHIYYTGAWRAMDSLPTWYPIDGVNYYGATRLDAYRIKIWDKNCP